MPRQSPQRCFSLPSASATAQLRFLTEQWFSAKLKSMKRTTLAHRQSLRQPAVFAWLRLARVFQKINMRSERSFREHKLSTGQFDVLAQVGAANGISQQQLAAALL